MSEKTETGAEQTKRLIEALQECRLQLEAAHAEFTDGGVGCDGTCSYHDAMRMADNVLAEVGAK